MAKDSCLSVCLALALPLRPQSNPRWNQQSGDAACFLVFIYISSSSLFFLWMFPAFVSLFNASLKIICELLCHIYVYYILFIRLVCVL